MQKTKRLFLPGQCLTIFCWTRIPIYSFCLETSPFSWTCCHLSSEQKASCLPREMVVDFFLGFTTKMINMPYDIPALGQKKFSKNHLKIFTDRGNWKIRFGAFATSLAFEALGPGPRNSQEASVGHFFHPRVAPYGTTAAPGCPPPGPTTGGPTGREASPKRSMRSLGPLFNSGYLGSARMSRRRITWFIPGFKSQEMRWVHVSWAWRGVIPFGHFSVSKDGAVD